MIFLLTHKVLNFPTDVRHYDALFYEQVSGISRYVGLEFIFPMKLTISFDNVSFDNCKIVFSDGQEVLEKVKLPP